ncbi:MAG TPA: Ig-like domain-containing protein, partial [Bacteroidales bacterium]|nr:Ig-like domain-containing protein [Bacteroidales bacterium]
MLHYKKFFLTAFLLFTIHHFNFAQNSNIFNINTDTDELTSVRVQVYFYLGLFQDSIVHLVWENYDQNNIRQVVVESSNDGINFTRCSGAFIANLFDIHILNYPKELEYNSTVLKSSESGNTRFIYNDVVPHADFKLQARWYRIKMHTNTGLIYTSQTVCTNDQPGMMPTKTKEIPNEKILNNHSEYTWVPGQKAGCSPVQTPPAGSTPTGNTQTFYGDCCSWVETQYQGASAVLTDCGGDSYAWCCNNVPGAAACASGYVSDPCCVHYCNEYNSCSCHPWECCASSTVNTWVVTQSSSYPPITVSVSASPSSICVGQCANLSASGASSYTWVGGNLPGSSSTGANISVCPTTTTTYTVTGTDSHNCTNTASVTITLNPPTISGTLSLCISATTQLTGSGTPATSNPWISTNTGIASVNNSGLVTGISAGTSNITYTNNFGCTNSATVTVKPTPTVTVPANITVCSGADVTGAMFTSNPPGGTYTWSNTNAAIGLAAGGTGNVPSFNATNTGTAPISGIITVTPTVNSCIGTPSSYTITVNPTPSVVVPSDITVCNGSSVSGTNFTSPTSGAIFVWTNSNTDIGLTGAGTGNIPLFTATNTGSDPISATITVVPSANSCPGTSLSYTVTVNPTPMVIVPADTTICDGTV